MTQILLQQKDVVFAEQMEHAASYHRAKLHGWRRFEKKKQEILFIDSIFHWEHKQGYLLALLRAQSPNPRDPTFSLAWLAG